jgi:hypothetical protein
MQLRIAGKAEEPPLRTMHWVRSIGKLQSVTLALRASAPPSRIPASGSSAYDLSPSNIGGCGAFMDEYEEETGQRMTQRAVLEIALAEYLAKAETSAT